MSNLATDRTSQAGIHDAVRRISEHAGALARLEADLAKAEIARKGKRLGAAAGMGAAAAVLAILGLGVALAAASVGLALVLPVWAALLAVSVATLLVAAALAAVAVRSAKRATPPVPEQAIEEAKLTKDALSEVRNGG